MSYTEGLELIITGDGSHSLRVKALDETYHSRQGAYTEARHVFIGAGLGQLFKLFKHKLPPGVARVNILEIGLGTGLNAILTLEQAILHNYAVNYVALEPHPLPLFVLKKLNYVNFLHVCVKDLFMRLHTLAWGEEYHAKEIFRQAAVYIFRKERVRLEDFTSAARFDLVYFDAFAASKQPELWKLSNFKKLAALMQVGGILVTYACNRLLKENLVKSGLKVTVCPGACGKRELVRAEKL